MQQSTKLAAVLSVLLLLMSCATSKNSRDIPNELAFCPAGAFAAEGILHVTPLASGEDQEFKRWAAELGTKYPELRKSYELLRECWNHYHVKE